MTAPSRKHCSVCSDHLTRHNVSDLFDDLCALCAECDEVEIEPQQE